MDSTQDSSTDGQDNQSAKTIGPYGYGFGFSFAILLIIIVFAYFHCIYSRVQNNADPNHNTRSGGSSNTNNDQSDCPGGLDEATLLNYPKLLYSEMIKPHKEHECSCSICLQDYKDTDMLRLLPDCGHFFHLKCVDPWLILHPTCPICRTSSFREATV